MYLLIANRVQEVTIRARQQNCDVQTVMHYAAAVDPWVDPATVTSTLLLSNLWAAWLAQIPPRQSDSLVYLDMQIKQVVGWLGGGGPGLSPIPMYDAQDELVLIGQAGLVLGAHLPTYVAVTGRKRTPTPSRRYTGSIRFGGIVEADTEAAQGNFLTAAAQTAWNNAWTNFRGSFIQSGANAADDSRLVVLSMRALSLGAPMGVPVNTRGFSSSVTGGSVNGYVGSQLSRKFRQPG